MSRSDVLREMAKSVSELDSEARRLKRMAESAEYRTRLSFQDKVSDLREKQWVFQELLEEYARSGEEARQELSVGLRDARRRLEASIKWARADFDPKGGPARYPGGATGKSVS